MSSKHHSSHSSHSQKRRRQYVLSFFVSAMLVVLSLAVCAKAFVVNPNSFSNIFTSREYVSSLHRDVVEYAEDQCRKCSVPEDFVKDVLTYERVYNAQSAYICSALGTSADYSVDAYSLNLDSIRDELKNAVEQELENQGISVRVKNGSQLFADSIVDSIDTKIQFKYVDKLQTISNIAGVLASAVAIVSAVVILIFALMMFKLKSKTYRFIRMLTYSVEGAALFDLILAAAVGVVHGTADLGIYPSYLHSAVVGYIGDTAFVIAMAGLILMFLALVMMTVVWYNKRHEE